MYEDHSCVIDIRQGYPEKDFNIDCPCQNGQRGLLQGLLARTSRCVDRLCCFLPTAEPDSLRRNFRTFNGGGAEDKLLPIRKWRILK